MRTRLLGCVASLFLLATLPRFLLRGMFVDGVTYAAIALNLAEGRGTAWRLFFTPSKYRWFTDHPPLGIWLQVPGYLAFGDELWVETAFSLVWGVLFLAAMASVWRAVGHHTTYGVWWSGLLLVVMPITSWAFLNNLLENIAGTFTSFAVACALLAARGSTTRALWAGIGSGVLLTAAFLTKGPVGLFPLASPLLASMVLPGVRYRQAMIATLAMLAAPMIFALWVSTHEEASAYLSRYLGNQVMRSLAGDRAVRSSRLYIVRKLFEEALLGPILVLSLASAVAKRWPAKRLEPPTRLMLAIALSASLPIVVSPKQSAFYLLPSLPYYALALASHFAALPAQFERWLEASPKRVRATRAFSATLAILAFVGMGVLRGRVIGNRDFNHDFVVQSLAIERDESAQVCPQQLKTFTLAALFWRHFRLDLKSFDSPHGLVLTGAGDERCALPQACEPIHPPTATTFTLFRCPLQNSPGQLGSPM